MLYMVQRIEFKTNTQPNNLQKKLSKDAKEIKTDKTTNYYYKTEPNDYVTFVNKNVTKTYKKTNPKAQDMITLKDEIIHTYIHIFLARSLRAFQFQSYSNNIKHRKLKTRRIIN